MTHVAYACIPLFDCAYGLLYLADKCAGSTWVDYTEGRVLQ